MSNQTVALSERLKSARVRRELTLAAMAAEVGVSKVTLWKWERGHSVPKRKWMDSLALALEVEPSDLEAQLVIRAEANISAASDLRTIIQDAKERIASCAGTTVDHIKIQIDW